MQVKKNCKGTSIFQEKYINEFLKEFQIVDSKTIDTHMGTNSKVDADGVSPTVNETMY